MNARLNGEGPATTPLEVALRLGDYSITRLLLEHGADPELRSNGLFRPRALHKAALYHSPLAVKILVEYGAAVNAQMDDGSTALHRACRVSPDREESESVEIVEFLLDQGADASLRQQDGFLPLHEAVCSGQREIVRLLLSTGRRYGWTGYSGCSAAEMARERGELAIANMIDGYIDGWKNM